MTDSTRRAKLPVLDDKEIFRKLKEFAQNFRDEMKKKKSDHHSSESVGSMRREEPVKNIRTGLRVENDEIVMSEASMERLFKAGILFGLGALVVYGGFALVSGLIGLLFTAIYHLISFVVYGMVVLVMVVIARVLFKCFKEGDLSLPKKEQFESFFRK